MEHRIILREISDATHSATISNLRRVEYVYFMLFQLCLLYENILPHTHSDLCVHTKCSRAIIVECFNVFIEIEMVLDLRRRKVHCALNRFLSAITFYQNLCVLIVEQSMVVTTHNNIVLQL